jgi:hypothetical protein
MIPPTAREIENKYEEIISGHCSRENADAWAGQWVYSSKPPEMAPAIWEALKLLAGCDLRHGKNEEYLHSNEQIAEWLRDFRRKI